MRNLLVTFASGDNFVAHMDCEIFTHSIKRFNSFEKVCLAHNLSKESIQELSRHFDHVVPAKHPIIKLGGDRLACYYEWLAPRVNEYELVMHCDLRDVILQRDPFEYMQKHPDKDLFFVSEGMTIGKSDWNAGWAEVFHTSLIGHKKDYRNDLVINGGTFGGKSGAFLNLCLFIYCNSNRIARSNIVALDQPVLNYLYPYLAQNPRIKICDPHDSEFCATGEGIKYGHVDVRYDANNRVLTPDNVPFYIFHQWDRTPMADKIRAKHKNTLTFFV